jgi:hypothetical protein
MGLIELIVVIVILAVVFLLIERYLVPLLPAPFGRIVMILLVIIAIFYLLGRIGIGPGIHL